MVAKDNNPGCEPFDAWVVDYLYDELSPADRQRFEEHIEHCSQHAQEVAELSSVLKVVRSGRAEDAPQPVIDRIVHLARAAEPARNRPPLLMRLIWNPMAAAAMLALVVITVGLAVQQQDLHPDHAPAVDQMLPVESPERILSEAEAAARPMEKTAASDLPASKAAPAKDVAKAEELVAAKTVAKKPAPRDRRRKSSAHKQRSKQAKKESAPKAAGAPRREQDEPQRDGVVDDLKIIGGGQMADKNQEASSTRGALGQASSALPSVPAASKTGKEKKSALAYQHSPQPPMLTAEVEKSEPEARPAMEQIRPAPKQRKFSKKSRTKKKSPAVSRDNVDLFGAAELDLAGKRYTAAVQKYRAFLQDSPHDRRSPTAYYRIGKALFLAGQCRQAIAAIGRAVQKAPGHGMAVTALFDQASCHIKLNQFAQARSIYRNIESNYPAHREEARRSLNRIRNN